MVLCACYPELNSAAAGDEVEVKVTRTIDGEPHVSSKATAYIFAD